MFLSLLFIHCFLQFSPTDFFQTWHLLRLSPKQNLPLTTTSQRKFKYFKCCKERQTWCFHVFTYYVPQKAFFLVATSKQLSCLHRNMFVENALQSVPGKHHLIRCKDVLSPTLQKALFETITSSEIKSLLVKRRVFLE